MARRNLKDFLSDDTLDLSLNDLQDVPVKEIKSFSTTLVHLVKLDLARNELKELPKNFGCLVNLKHLDLYKNKLENLPLSFGNLKALRWLDLKENPLEPHWQQIAGPCLNAQDCKNAARNVVNIASMMSDEIEAEVRSHGRHKQEADEQEEREQGRRRDRQREKKRRRNAARLAEANSHLRKAEEEDSLVGVEPVTSPLEEYLPDQQALDKSSNPVRTVLGGFLKGVLYFWLMISVSLSVLRFVNRPLYDEILRPIFTHNFSSIYASLSSGQTHKYVKHLNINLIDRTKTFAFTFWSTSSKMWKTLYFFVTTDPKFEIYLNYMIHIFLYLYVTLCNFVSLCFNTVLNII